MRLRYRSAVTALFVFLPALAGSAVAQGRGHRFEESERPAPLRRVSVGVMGGMFTFGRFLEQHVTGGDRELKAGASPGFAGSLDLNVGKQTAVRASFLYAPATLEFRDDTGTGSTRLDRNNLADLHAAVVSGDVLQFVVDQRRPIAPYAVAGFAAGFWSLNNAADEIAGGASGSRETRFGSVVGVGVQLRATPGLALRLEATSDRLGNPFDGNDSFRVTSGDTFDEPSKSDVNRISLALVFSPALHHGRSRARRPY